MRGFNNEDIMRSAEHDLQIGKTVVLGIDGSYDTLKSILTIELNENADIFVIGARAAEKSCL